MIIKFNKPQRKVNKIVVHCSASDIEAHDNIETIRKWHVDQNGWDDIGYHYFITKDGKIHNARDIETIPAAQKIYDPISGKDKAYNTNSIAICLSGEYLFTFKQFNSLQYLVNLINIEYNRILKILGHRDLDSRKTCPNFDLNQIKVL